jgi:hypothetical protein
MKIKQFFLAAAVTLCGFTASAQIITFDDVGVPDHVYPNYTQQGFVAQGFFFSTNTDVIDISATAPWNGTGPAHSGSFALLNDYGGDMTMVKQGGGTFGVQDLFIRSWYSGSFSALVTGYLNNTQVGQVALNVNGSWDQVLTQFGSIDKLTVGGGTFLVDDINVNVTAVPEVETYAMMLTGLALMGTVVRRRKVKLNA